MLLVPYALQLAHSSTRLQLTTLLAGLAASIPLTIVSANYWGPAGAAAVWLLLNLVFLSVMVPLTLRRFLAGETKRWAIRDALLPLSAVLIAGAVVRLAYRETDSHVLAALQLCIAFAFVALCCIASADLARNWVRRRMSGISGQRF